MGKAVRCRFAPSPTGYLHVGGARTALFNYLFARSCGGKFILRIEDTDLQRSTPEAVDAILEGLDWLAITPDEGPFYQTRRMDLYAQYASRLLASGHAYRCFMSSEELEELRNAQRERGEKPRYDGRFRPLSITPQPSGLPTAGLDTPFVIRFRAPQDGATVFHDCVLGDVATPNDELEDFIIVRSDGSPTYNFTVVVDDIEMQISHVIRGSDHVSNTPKQVAMYEALGAELPEFVHVPMILGSDKKKLSKRHGATSVIEYRKDGYLPDGFVNYLVRLGWSHGDQEIFSRAELEKIFDVDSVGKSPAVFDFDKLRWVNGEHLKQYSGGDLLTQIGPFLFETSPNFSELKSSARFVDLLESLRERASTMVDMAAQTLWFFAADDSLVVEEAQRAKLFVAAVAPALEELKSRVLSEGWKSSEDVDVLLKSVAANHSLKMGQIAQPVRLSLTGTMASPPLGTVFHVLGAERIAARLSAAQKWIAA